MGGGRGWERHHQDDEFVGEPSSSSPVDDSEKDRGAPQPKWDDEVDMEVRGDDVPPPLVFPAGTLATET